jgi:hypothetical protein
MIEAGLPSSTSIQRINQTSRRLSQPKKGGDRYHNNNQSHEIDDAVHFGSPDDDCL